VPSQLQAQKRSKGFTKVFSTLEFECHVQVDLNQLSHLEEEEEEEEEEAEAEAEERKFSSCHDGRFPRIFYIRKSFMTIRLNSIAFAGLIVARWLLGLFCLLLKEKHQRKRRGSLASIPVSFPLGVVQIPHHTNFSLTSNL
jgi:hypothetical protein